MSATVAILIAFAGCLILSVPIAMSMVISAAVPAFMGTSAVSINNLIVNTFAGADTTPILAVPLFILAGVIMAEGGISRKLFNFFAYFFGKVTGGLPCAVILTCLFYGAISGSGPATCAAVGAMAIPFLVDLGYDRSFCAGMVATAGGLGVIIPPSIPFVLYSLATGVSTSQLFLAGILPGIFIGLCLMAYAVIYCLRKGEDKARINEKVGELRANGLWRTFRDSFWALLSPIIVLGGIYGGIVTPTEAACISVFYSVIVSLFVYRTIKFKDIGSMLKNAVKTFAPLCFVIAFATAFGRVMTLVKASDIVSNFILGTFNTQVTALAGVLVLFFLIGMVMDVGPAMVILGPILLPAMMELGVDPVHFGVIMVITLAVGMATPPFGLNLFVAGTLSEVPPMTVAKQAVPFVIAFAIAMLIITYVPALSLVFL